MRAALTAHGAAELLSPTRLVLRLPAVAITLSGRPVFATLGRIDPAVGWAVVCRVSASVELTSTPC